VIVAFDITNHDSFQNVNKWLQEVERYAGDQVDKILIGNKLDNADSRKVTENEANLFVEALGLMYMETSALDGRNVEEAFKKITAIAVTKIRAQKATAAALPTAESVKLSGGQRPDTWCSC